MALERIRLVPRNWPSDVVVMTFASPLQKNLMSRAREIAAKYPALERCRPRKLLAAKGYLSCQVASANRSMRHDVERESRRSSSNRSMNCANFEMSFRKELGRTGMQPVRQAARAAAAGEVAVDDLMRLYRTLCGVPARLPGKRRSHRRRTMAGRPGRFPRVSAALEQSADLLVPTPKAEEGSTPAPHQAGAPSGSFRCPTRASGAQPGLPVPNQGFRCPTRASALRY